MLEKLEIKGYWWLPGSNNQVSGILFYDSDEIRLELLGTLKELSSTNKDLNQHETIIGFTERGEKITLISCNSSNFSMNFSGYSTESYSVTSFIVGGHFDSIENTSFHSVSFYPTYLTTWLEKGPFKVFHDSNSDKQETEIKYVAPEVISISVPSINATIEDTYKSNLNGNPNEYISWNFKSGIKITPDCIKSFNWFEEKLFSLNNLLTLLFGMPIYYENIIFFGDEKHFGDTEKTKRDEYYWFFNQSNFKIKEKIRKTDFMIPYSEISESFPNIVNLWFDKEGNLKTVYELYISDFYKDIIYIDTSFLNVVQTLETYHRRTHNGKIYDEDVFEKYRNEVIEFVIENLPQELHSKFTSKYGNEYSLNQRLKEIVSELSLETINTLFMSKTKSKKFIQQIVDTRNYLTHFDEDGKKNLLTSIDEKYYAIIRLRALNTILLFKELGIDEDMILKKVRESKQYSYSLTEANKILSS